jgi:nicotinate-nucleotide adenylyltransferase
MNIGLFGGSFNPPHVGHLIVLESIRDQLQLEKILIIPSSQTPNKHDSLLAPSSARLDMTRFAFEGNPACEVSDMEIRRHGISYTVDTVRELAEAFQHAKLSLIIGADNFLDFQSWRAPEEILTLADLVIMNRPGFEPKEARSDFLRRSRIVNVPMIGISGTDIRRRVKLGRSIRYLVPRSVEEYIYRNGLYRS